jgi:uroporphyrinogen-III decarboxylase
MWRQWDKPYLQAITEEIHKQGKLLHIHFHGKSIETVSDFAEIGIDCVCPFERAPGGDINTLEDLKYVREKLQNKVTFNGNVHTVETLIRGDEKKVRDEVLQIKEAFKGSARLIIGSGDQVGRETPEENIFAMIDEGIRV